MVLNSREFAGVRANIHLERSPSLPGVQRNKLERSAAVICKSRAVTLLNLGGTARFPVISSQEYLFLG